MSRVVSIVAALTVVSSAGLTSQEIRVTREGLVMAAPSWGALVEPHITAHPSRPGWLVGGVIVRDTGQSQGGRSDCAAIVSQDAGATWSSHPLGIEDCADPWVAVTASGEAVYLALGKHSAHARPNVMGLLVARSADGGLTWNDTLTSLGPEQDRPTLAVDPRPSAERSVVVVSGHGVRVDDGPLRWSVYVARSVNAGRSFRLPVDVIPSNLNLNAAESVILEDGTIMASFVDFQRNVGGFAGESGMLARRRIWMLRSRDDGRTFSPPLFVSEDCGRSSYDVATDRSSSRHRGRIYVACRDADGPGVILLYSDDAGEQWSPAIVVAAPESGEAYAVQPRLSVNRDGVVAIAWIESAVMNDAICNRLLAAASADGGATFGASREIAPFSCPDPARNGFAFRRWRHGGDYFGWTADSVGHFQALFADARRGPFELRAARVAVQL